MKNNILILVLLCLAQVGFSSSFEVNYFGDIDRPLPKLIVVNGNGYAVDMDFKRGEGFELTVVIQDTRYNKIIDNIINSSVIRVLLSPNSYFICKTAEETYYFLGLTEMLNILNFAISIIDNQEVISHLIDYMRRVEILFIRFGDARVPGNAGGD
jgi:hypothetical protein